MNQFAGSRLYVPDQSVDRLTANQMELVALGPAPVRDDDEVEARTRDTEVQGLVPGDWLILTPRSWIEGPDPDTYLIDQSVILAVLR